LIDLLIDLFPAEHGVYLCTDHINDWCFFRCLMRAN